MSRRIIADLRRPAAAGLGPEIVGSCSVCGYLGFCDEKLVDRRRRILICAECQAELANDQPSPILPLAPMPQPKPPKRETGAAVNKSLAQARRPPGAEQTKKAGRG